MVEYQVGKTYTNLRKNKKREESIKVKSIIEIEFKEGYVIYVYPGTLSKNDMLIKFKNRNIKRSQQRQLKHIHWVVDILIKKEKDPELTNQFLKFMLKRWETVFTLPDRDYTTIFDNLILSKNEEFIKRFEKLNEYGFFNMNLIIHLIEMMMLQEKTNYPKAYMFRDVVNLILTSKDLYSIISKATHS